MAVGKRRSVRRIQEYLDAGQLNLSEVARALGIAPQTVWKTAHGMGNNRKTLRHFLEIGVPADILDLPKDLLKELEEKRKAVA